MVKQPYYLDLNSTVGDWRKLLKITHHSKFPVVDAYKKVVGIATTNDIVGVKDEVAIRDVMSKDPIIVTENTPVAHAARLMVWESIDLIPLYGRKLIGATRQDAIKALQTCFNPDG